MLAGAVLTSTGGAGGAAELPVLPDRRLAELAVGWPVHDSACPAVGSTLPMLHCNPTGLFGGSRLKHTKIDEFYY